MYKDTWLVLYLSSRWLAWRLLRSSVIREVTSGKPPPPNHTLHHFVSFLFSYRNSCKPI